MEEFLSNFTERFERASDKFFNVLESVVTSKYFIIFAVGLLAGNIIVLDISALNGSQNNAAYQEKVSPVSVPASPQLSCPQSCISDFMNVASIIQTQATASASISALISNALPTQTPIPTAVVTPTVIQTPTPTPTSVPTVKEYYIPLGQGFGTATDWTTITGIGATVNPSNYGQIANVYFEATVRIPTGNQTVYVRLYNADTYQSVANSDLTLSGGTSTILTSSPISLSGGSNLYQVQLKTQLGFTTNIDQARIRIVTK